MMLFLTQLSNKSIKYVEWLKVRIIGMPIQMAKRFQDLIDRYNQLTREEKIEHKTYINLRAVLIRTNGDLETRLAIQDFGIKQMYQLQLQMPNR